ncbi:MAG: phosphoglycerate dehydrogenase [Dehalococcoidia bacterium]
MKVLIADPIDQGGIDLLKEHQLEVDVITGLEPQELVRIIPEYDALVVRSQTKVGGEVIEAGGRLLVIGRAGVGVDNIDLKAATARGIIVVNAPESNTLSAAEHTIGLMLALARNIPQAHSQLKSGKWDRKSFVGVEVRNKKMGIIGMGKVGAEVAKRCQGLDMDVLAYDPMVSDEQVKSLGVKPVAIEEVLRDSDFITVHVPLTDATRGLIGETALKKVKPSVRFLNVARGGVIDEEALFKAIEEGRVAGAAIDVFSREPATDNILLKSDKVIVTPHLGASTVEAQTGVARDVAEQIVEVLEGRPARYTVNMPMIPPDAMPFLSPFLYMGSIIAGLAAQLADGRAHSILIKYEGEIAECRTDALKAAIIGGLLETTSEERINMVNADLVARRRGIKVSEQESVTCESYSSVITIEVTTNVGTTTVAGTILRGEPHIVRVNEYFIDIIPSGAYWLFSDHLDRPGLIASVAKVTGEANINISSMYVARQQVHGQALMVLCLDEPLSEEHLERIRAVPDVYSARVVRL